MSRNHFVLALSLLVLAGCATSMTPRANTRSDVAAWVTSASEVVAKNGPSCQTFKEPRWMSGDWYIFVSEADGTTLCHPDPRMVGTAVSTIVDANGARVGDALAAAANSAAGSGWVDYVWPRPGQTTPVSKSSYVVRVNGPDGKTYIVGGGGYELR